MRLEHVSRLKGGVTRGCELNPFHGACNLLQDKCCILHAPNNNNNNKRDPLGYPFLRSIY